MFMDRAQADVAIPSEDRRSIYTATAKTLSFIVARLAMSLPLPGALFLDEGPPEHFAHRIL